MRRASWLFVLWTVGGSGCSPGLGVSEPPGSSGGEAGARGDGTGAVPGSVGGDSFHAGGREASGGSDAVGSGGRLTADGGTADSGNADGGAIASDGGSPSSSGGSGPSPTNPCWQLDGFLDDFRDPELTSGCWSVYRDDLLVGGSSDRGYSHDDHWGLVLRPKAGHAWESADSGVLLYQEVRGNFRLEAQLWVLGGAAPSEDAPSAAGARVGLVALSAGLPATGDSATDYFAIKVGTMESALSAGFEASVTSSANATETRTRVDSDPEAWENSYLRLCRVGAQIWSAYLPSGESEWIPLHEDGSSIGYDTRAAEFPDLGETMVVGLIGELTDPDAEDGSVRAILGRAEFSIPTDIDDCWKQF